MSDACSTFVLKGTCLDGMSWIYVYTLACSPRRLLEFFFESQQPQAAETLGEGVIQEDARAFLSDLSAYRTFCCFVFLLQKHGVAITNRTVYEPHHKTAPPKRKQRNSREACVPQKRQMLVITSCSATLSPSGRANRQSPTETN